MSQSGKVFDLLAQSKCPTNGSWDGGNTNEQPQPLGNHLVFPFSTTGLAKVHLVFFL